MKLTADDPGALDTTYEQWCTGAEKAFQELKDQPGVRPVKVMVDVQVLRQWCRNHGKRLDGDARAQYIAEAAKTMIISEN